MQKESPVTSGQAMRVLAVGGARKNYLHLYISKKNSDAHNKARFLLWVGSTSAKPPALQHI